MSTSWKPIDLAHPVTSLLEAVGLDVNEAVGRMLAAGKSYNSIPEILKREKAGLFITLRTLVNLVAALNVDLEIRVRPKPPT